MTYSTTAVVSECKCLWFTVLLLPQITDSRPASKRALRASPRRFPRSYPQSWLSGGQITLLRCSLTCRVADLVKLLMLQCSFDMSMIERFQLFLFQNIVSWAEFQYAFKISSSHSTFKKLKLPFTFDFAICLNTKTFVLF